MRWSNASLPQLPLRLLVGSTNGFRKANTRSMLTMILILCVVQVTASLLGCGNNRTIFVPEDSPMRLGPSTRARVWTRVAGEKDWVLSSNSVPLPEGWYIVPSSYVREVEPK